MIELKHSCVGTRCPVCAKNVIDYINRFQFTSGTELKCPTCSAPIITIQKSKTGINLSLNCFACGKIHTYTHTKNGIFSQNICSFACKETDIDVLFTGNYEDVDVALFQLAKEISRLTDKYYESLESGYGSLIIAALKIIEQKTKERRVICLCGNSEINIKLLDNGIELVCTHCGGKESIPVQSDEDINSLMNRRSILIK